MDHLTIQDEPKRIPRYRPIGGMENLSLPKGAKICFGSSVYGEDHNGVRLAGQISFLSNLAKQCQGELHVLPNDTGNRFAYRIDHPGMSEEEAKDITRLNGNDWLLQNSAIWKHFKITETRDAPTLEEKTFPRWEDFRNNRQDKAIDAEFQRALAGYHILAAVDPEDFGRKLDQTAYDFMQRGERPLLPRFQKLQGQKRCRDFLLEENAVFAMCRRRYDAFAYPGPMLLCQVDAAEGRFNIPADLNFDRLSKPVQACAKIIRDCMKAGQTDAEALREAVGGGFMHWIQLRRSGKYDYDTDLSASIGSMRRLSKGSYTTLGDKQLATAASHALSGDISVPAPSDADEDLLEKLNHIKISPARQISTPHIPLLRPRR